MNTFSIIVGRWYGVWSWIWYADLMVDNSNEPFVTFNALSRRGALRKATRYIRRHKNHKKYVYVYDESINKLERIDV
jgi:hypothetical protein